MTTNDEVVEMKIEDSSCLFNESNEGLIKTGNFFKPISLYGVDSTAYRLTVFEVFVTFFVVNMNIHIFFKYIYFL